MSGAVAQPHLTEHQYDVEKVATSTLKPAKQNTTNVLRTEESVLTPQIKAQKPATKSVQKPPANNAPSFVGTGKYPKGEAPPIKGPPSKTPGVREIEIHCTPETDALFRQTRAFEKAEALENKQRAAGKLPPVKGKPQILTLSRPAQPTTAPQARAPSVSVASELPGFQRQASHLPALEAPKMSDHHIFPQQFKKFFEQKGINIDEFTVSVGETTHLKGLHGKGNAGLPGKWNKKWLRFIEENPNASDKDIYQFAGKLMDRYKINNLNIHGYKK